MGSPRSYEVRLPQDECECHECGAPLFVGDTVYLDALMNPHCRPSCLPRRTRDYPRTQGE